MIEKVIEEFNKYTSSFDKTNKAINLKYNHSFAVMDLMAELGFRLDLTKEQIELARVIGLLHDIGRFNQLKNTNSFDDNVLDHGEEGVKYLFDEGHIRDFIDDSKYDEIIKKAIKYHNYLSIPDGLSDEELLFTKMIRDMDKVDIYKQEAINYELVFKADEVTEKVLIDFKDEKQIDKNTRKTKTDDLLLMLSFIFDINFEESFDILVGTDNFDLFLSMVNVDEYSEKLWNKVREICFDKINRGIGDK